ncbi:MAG TPA: alpha/beta hydrolase [Sphingomonadaceae bacterium]|nr:alpha/beta hydrolase [Sphingomonadaceae bacterium]
MVPIGDIEQWVTIRGADCANPVILFLHGGPGNPLSPFSEAIYGTWENDFTLVQWDQRGTGMTYLANPPPQDLTVDRMVADGLALSEYLSRAMGQEKLILLAGSWGTVLGVRMALERPDLFHAYLGAGQLVSGPENQAASYRKVLERARTAGDEDIVATLEALGPPPWSNPRNPGILRRATRVFEGKDTVPPPEHWWSPAADYTDAEFRAANEAGEEFSYIEFIGMDGQGMLSRLNLPDYGLSFEIPVFLVHGEEDLVTVPEVARRYFDSLAAPEKEFRLLEATGHDPNAAMIDAEYEILKTRIMPLAQ